jgi:hypothetical protein
MCEKLLFQKEISYALKSHGEELSSEKRYYREREEGLI